VPELAVSLVIEDLDVDAGRAHEIIDESADIGELLNKENDDKLPKRIETQVLEYGGEELEDV